MARAGLPLAVYRAAHGAALLQEPLRKIERPGQALALGGKYYFMLIKVNLSFYRLEEFKQYS